jgi:hypothetical protein
MLFISNNYRRRLSQRIYDHQIERHQGNVVHSAPLIMRVLKGIGPIIIPTKSKN